MVSSVMSALILLPFLSVALHVSGTRNVLLGPWPNNTEVFLSPLLVLKITQLQDKFPYYVFVIFSWKIRRPARIQAMIRQLSLFIIFPLIVSFVDTLLSLHFISVSLFVDFIQDFSFRAPSKTKDCKNKIPTRRKRTTY